MTNPVLVELTRGGLVESVHRGAVAIADARGRLAWSVGDVETPIFARSALKMLQAIALVETGAADAFAVSPRELSLACASHSGEAFHVEAVSAWLGRVDCDETCLACGAHPPINEAAARALVREGRSPTRLHNNCSGKHTGFITLARHLGVDPKGYETSEHPVQRRVLATIAEMAGVDLAAMTVAVDGCTAPAPAMPLAALAAAMARIADPAGLAADRMAATQRLEAAVRAHPLYMSGTGRPCAEIIRAAAGAASVKTGAEGVFVAVLREAGLGVALKIDDGAGRAAETAIAHLLIALGAVPADAPAVADLARGPVRNTRGEPVGERRAVPWLGKQARAACFSNLS